MNTDLLQKIIGNVAGFFKNVFQSKPIPVPVKVITTNKSSEIIFPTQEQPPNVTDKELPVKSNWSTPILIEKFSPYKENEFLKYDPDLYPTTKHHTGVDYSTHGATDIPLYFCCDGEVIESGFLEKSLGNYFCFYILVADHTFIYCHLRDEAPAKGKYKSGEIAGIAGNTGKSKGVHLHLECLKGRKTFAGRIQIYTSESNLLKASGDGTIQNADTFIRRYL